jgi:predicted aspartyl protease
VLSTVCAASSLAAPDEVRFRLDAPGAVLIAVEIDGAGPFTFLLDTGSSHTIVSTELAERLDLPIVAKTTITTAAGTEVWPVAAVRRLAIGGAAITGLMPSVLSAAALRKIDPGIGGIVGQDFLSAFNYTLDYSRRRLTWIAGAPPDDERSRLPLLLVDGRFLVELWSQEERRPVLMVPDSGADGFLLFERGGRTAMKVDHMPQSIGVGALAGAQTARAAIAREIRIGPVRFINQAVAVLNREGVDSHGADGILPLHVFSTVSFNSRDRYLTVTR